MVFTVTQRIKIDKSAFQTLLRNLNEACNTVVVSGVINGDEETTENAVLNEFGGTGIYKHGPFAGQTVEVPPRPFVTATIEHGADEVIIVAEESLDLEKDPTLVKALNAMGKKAKELQEKPLKTNGEGVAGWQKHNSPRTIETKGFDKPLYTEEGSTFPIDYELVRRRA